MKKILFVFLALSLVNAGDAFAERGKREIDAVTGNRKSCDSGNRNKRIFCKAPKVSVCTVHGGWKKDRWSNCTDMPCSGYSVSGFVEEIMEWEAVNTTTPHKTACWQYKCKGGFIPMGKSCITPADCVATPGYDLSSDKKSCVASNWCSDSLKASYDASIHEPDNAGSCASLKCKPGYCFLSSTDLKSCDSAVDGDGTFGGTYPDNTTGVCKTCAKEEYVKVTIKSGKTTYSCVKGHLAGRDILGKCYGCNNETDFEKCVKSGGSKTCSSGSSASGDSSNSGNNTNNTAAANSSSGSGTGNNTNNTNNTPVRDQNHLLADPGIAL